MQLRFCLPIVVAAACISCSATPEKPTATAAVAAGPVPTTFASEQDELAYLRAENARLRGQNQTVVTENATIKNRAAAVEAQNKSIESGKLEPGMTLFEANKAINGSANLYKDTCQLIGQTDDTWTYRILTGSPTNNPGSGGVAPAGTNMRGGRAAPVQAWICTFDSRTQKLTAFRRELSR